MAGGANSKRCIIGCVGGALGGLIAAIGGSKDFGELIGTLFGNAGDSSMALVVTVALLILGAIGGYIVIWASLPACDGEGPPPPPRPPHGGTGAHPRVADKALVTVIWTLTIYPSAQLLFVWPGQHRSLAFTVLMGTMWAVGVIAQFLTALVILKNRQTGSNEVQLHG